MLDAKRLVDDMPVFLKVVLNSSPELEIGAYMSSPGLRNDSRNHCVPYLDVFPDPLSSAHSIIVLPLLHAIDQPLPESIRECVDFIEQTLEVSFRDVEQWVGVDLS